MAHVIIKTMAITGEIQNTETQNIDAVLSNGLRMLDVTWLYTLIPGNSAAKHNNRDFCCLYFEFKIIKFKLRIAHIREILNLI